MSGGGYSESQRWEPDHGSGVGSRLWSKLLWVAIIVSCLGIHLLQVFAQSSMTANPTPPPQEVVSMELRYAARVGFGAERLEAALGAGAQGSMGDVTSMLETSATGPMEHLRAAIAAAALNEWDFAKELVSKAGVQLSELEASLEPPADAEEAAAREQWFVDMRRDLEVVSEAVERTSAEGISDTELIRLEDRHGDFGLMVRIIGAPESDPLRQSFSDRGFRTLVSVVVMAGLAITAILAGSVLFIVAMVLLLTGRVRPRLNIQRQWDHGRRTLLLEAFLLFLVSFVGVMVLSGVIEGASGLDLTIYLLWLLLLTPLWPLVRGMSWADLHVALGWHANGEGIGGVIKETACGVVGYLAGLPIVLVGAAISILLVVLTHSQPSHPAVSEAMNADLKTAIKLFVLASLWAPIVEETVFRGLLYYNMRKWAHPLLSALVVAFLFAIIHPQGIALVPALMGLAVVFALMREWRGSIIAPMVAHGMHNAFIITMVILVFGT